MDQYFVIAIAVGGGVFVLGMGALWKIAYEWPKYFGPISIVLQLLNVGAIMALLGFNRGVYLANEVAPGLGLAGLAFSTWWALLMIGAMIYIFCLGQFVTKLKPLPDKRRKRRSSGSSGSLPTG
jgi:hypothetical protein